MTMTDFITCCHNGSFIDYDGFGHYATVDQVSNKIITPSQVLRGEIDRNFTHVLWYNR